MFGKIKDKSTLDIEVKGAKVKIIEQTRCLGIFVGKDGRGKLSYEPHYKVLKGRFRYTGEKISFLKNMVKAKHLADITRGIMIGIYLHAMDYIPPPLPKDIKVLQKIYLRSMRGVQETQFWKRQLRKANNQDSKAMAASKAQLGGIVKPDRGLELLHNLRHNTLALMGIKQGLNAIYKAMRYHQPVTAHESISECAWIYKSNTRICRLPDMFREERARKKADLLSRFDYGRTPGILTREELKKIWDLRLYERQVRSI